MYNSPFTLDTRTLEFSKKILVFCKHEPITSLNRSLMDQLIRSATSIGANYAEANNAASRTDFRNKIFIAKKEAAETKYWLSLMMDLASESNQSLCSELLTECHHLLMTFQKIINTLNYERSKPATSR